MRRHLKIEFTVEYINETPAAILVLYQGEQFWLPKSQITWIGAAEEGDLIEVGVPRWLAEEKEMTL